MNRKSMLALVAFIVVVTVIIGWFILGNQLQSSKGFCVYLSKGDELVISDKDIMFYNWTSHHIKLNGEGIERIKKIDFFEKLYHKSFVVMLNGKEMYKGSFWSDIDSTSYSGVVIIDVLAVQNNITDTLRIEPCYPSVQFCEGADHRNNPEILNYFQSIGKIVF
ncbi:MAG: hypothetical protein QXJ17_08440 [Nitrososphaeria archaeon]